MKRLALVAAVLVIAACTTKEETADRDTAALAPAPAMSDTMKMMDSTMKHDSSMKMGMPMTKADSAKMTKKP